MPHDVPAMKLAIITLVVFLTACKAPEKRGEVAIDDIETAPTVVGADAKWADVYKPLDGKWQGKFKIYADTRGQQPGPRPTSLDAATLEIPPYRLSQTIDVHQHYESESPYFQRVRITDTYADGRTVESRGVNKVQDGKMWCVVKKPDDLVIHEGTTDGSRTIIWSRDRESPLAVEWFHETVEDDSYDILGWGYYGKDDPSLAPRMYFHGAYQRVE